MSSVKNKLQNAPNENPESTASPTPPAEPIEQDNPVNSTYTPAEEMIKLVAELADDIARLIPTRYVTVTQRRKFGNVEHEISITNAVWVTSALQQQAEVDKLTEQVNGLHDHYAKEHLPNTNVGATAQPKTAAPRNDYEAERLVLTITAGKKYYAIITKTGRWHKFGCPVWKETVEKYHLEELIGAGASLELHDVWVTCEDREKSGAVLEIRGLK